MQAKHILITGNMGYVGPAVIRELRAAYPNALLTGYDTGFFAHCLTGATVLPESRLDNQLFGDIRDLPDEALEGVDAIVNLAAISNDPMGNVYEQATMDVNCHAAVALAKRAKAKGCTQFRVRLKLQRLWLHRRRPAKRGRPAKPSHRLCPIQNRDRRAAAERCRRTGLPQPACASRPPAA